MHSVLVHTCWWYKAVNQMSCCKQQNPSVFKVRRFKQELHAFPLTAQDTEAQDGCVWELSCHRRHGWAFCSLHPAVSSSHVPLSTMIEWPNILNLSVKGESFRKLTFTIVNTHMSTKSVKIEKTTIKRLYYIHLLRSPWHQMPARCLRYDTLQPVVLTGKHIVPDSVVVRKRPLSPL